MTTDTLKEKAAPRARRTAGGKIVAKPNYILLGLGIVLIFVQIFADERIHSLMVNAALLAVGVTQGEREARELVVLLRS